MMNRPIGVFDSGIGGVTVLDKLIEMFPNEDFIYLGDTINLPYGTKSKEQLESIITGVAEKLIARDVKAIVIACNTATANSMHLSKITDIPIIGVVEPTAKYSISQSANKKIAVLATNVTIDSGIYQKYIEPEAKGYYIKCSEFVDQIEASNIDTPSSHQLVRSKLEHLQNEGIDTVIHGCTHFGLYAKEIKAVLPDANQISCALPTAMKLAEVLEEKKLRFTGKKVGSVEINVTGDPEVMKPKLNWFTKPYNGIYKI